jgi:hypothetical protein
MSKVWLHSDLANSALKLFQRKRKIYVNELLKYVDNIRKDMKACCFINMNANDDAKSGKKSDGREALFYGALAYGVDKRESLIKILEKSGFNDDEIEEELMTVILAVREAAVKPAVERERESFYEAN